MSTYTPIEIKRNPVTSSDFEIKMEEREEVEPETQEVEVEEEQEEEQSFDSDLELDVESGEEVSEEKTKEETKKKSKKPRGRPKGSTNKKRDKRIQQLLEQKKQEAERAARLEAELEQMQRQMFESNKQSTSKRKESIEQTLNSLQRQLKNAIEEDDAEQIVDIQNKMMQANMEYAAVSYELSNVPEEYVAPERPKQTASEPSPYAEEWIEDHPEFSQDDEFHHAALGVNAKLLKEGYDPESPEFYDELDKRLSKRYPEYFNYDDDTSSKNMLQYEEDTSDDDVDYPQTVAGASRTPSGSTSGKKSGRKTKNTVVLTPEDQELCKKWGIDPVTFAKRKQSLEKKDRGDYVNI